MINLRIYIVKFYYTTKHHELTFETLHITWKNYPLK